MFKAFQILFAISSGVIATVVLLAFVLRVIDARLDLAFVPNTAWVETSFGELPQGDVDIQRTPGGLTIQLRCHALEFYRWRKEAPRNLADGFILSLKEPGMSDDKIVDTLLEWIAFSNKIDRTTAVYGDSLTFNGGELDVRISAFPQSFERVDVLMVFYPKTVRKDLLKKLTNEWDSWWRAFWQVM